MNPRLDSKLELSDPLRDANLPQSIHGRTSEKNGLDGLLHKAIIQGLLFIVEFRQGGI